MRMDIIIAVQWEGESRGKDCRGLNLLIELGTHG